MLVIKKIARTRKKKESTDLWVYKISQKHYAYIKEHIQKKSHRNFMLM